MSTVQPVSLRSVPSLRCSQPEWLLLPLALVFLMICYSWCSPSLIYPLIKHCICIIHSLPITLLDKVSSGGHICSQLFMRRPAYVSLSHALLSSPAPTFATPFAPLLYTMLPHTAMPIHYLSYLLLKTYATSEDIVSLKTHSQ